MRIAFLCFLIAAPIACADAAEISPKLRGTWAENGDCTLSRRIQIDEKTIKLVEPARSRTLIDGEEAVFKGETLINASLPTTNEADAVLALTAKVIEEDGETKLVVVRAEDSRGFVGTYGLCEKDAPHTRIAAGQKAPRDRPRTNLAKTAPAARSSDYAALGGLY